MSTRAVTVNDVLGGDVALDLEYFDRIYLNGYVPNLQVGGQVVNFLTSRGFPIPSPSLLEKNGDRFRHAVANMQVIEAIISSARSRSWVNVETGSSA